MKPDYDGARTWLTSCFSRLTPAQLATFDRPQVIVGWRGHILDAPRAFERAAAVLETAGGVENEFVAEQLRKARLAPVPVRGGMRNIRVVTALREVQKRFGIAPTRSRQRRDGAPCGIELVIEAMRAAKLPAISYDAAEKLWRNRELELEALHAAKKAHAIARGQRG